MRVLDLFSGIGGFSLAAHWMGWETAAFVEKDLFCQKVLNKNFPGVPIYDDITTFSGEPFRGRIGIVTGGFPCQPFSQAGKQKGRGDDRHLFPEMLRVISEIKPRWVVAENVRGILSIESGSVFEEVTASLESEGYEVATFCIPACAVDAPHRRDRIWFVAHANCDRTLGEGRNGNHHHHFERNAAAEIQEWKDLELGAEFADRAPSTNSTERGRRQGREVAGGAREGTGTASERRGLTDGIGDAADTESERPGEAREFRCDESEKWIAGNDSVTTLAAGEGLSGREFSGTSGQGTRSSRSITERFANESWLEAAARLCSLDDGISGGLVRPKGWRVNALKAAGNAIMPLIPYEIFKAITDAEDLTI